MGVILAAQALRLDLSSAVVEPRRIVLAGEGGVRRELPLDESGYLSIDWYLKAGDSRLATKRFYEVWDRAAMRRRGEAPAPDWVALWKGRIVVLGSTATGNNVSDMGGTPLEQQTYLVSKHWNVANTIITGRFIRRTSLPVELLLVLGLGLGAALVTWRFRAPWPTLWVAVGALVYVGLAFLLYVQFRLWMPIILPVVGAMFLNHISVETYRVVFEQKEKRRVKSVFAKLVSPNVVDEMLKSEHLNLGGSRRQITVFFADVRGFTSMTDEYAAKADEYVRTHHLEGEAAEAYFNQQAALTLDTVNMYLSTIADKVKEHKGTLDKYMGDCVMAFWGMPTPNPQHALSCVRAAIDAQRAMGALNQKRFEENKLIEAENLERQKRGEEPRQLNTLLALGTGINTGYAIIGLMGSERHILNYTVFGREVNIASRLEGVSGRGRIIIGEATYRDILRDAPELAATCMELEPVLVKGIKKPVRIYEVPWKLQEEKMPEQTTDAGSTGFFRLEPKDTVMLTKPSDPTPDHPAEPEAPKPS
jgi:adenylate cyclase